MPDDTSAPVTAEGLRERITEIFLDWENVRWEEDTPNAEQIGNAVDRVLAALAGDPGDLRERLVRAMHAVVVCDPTEAVTIGALAAAAMSVRWEDHAATLARLAQAEARVAELEAEQVAASEEVFRLMAHSDETCSVVAERDRLRARLTAVAIHANRLNTYITPRSDAWRILGDLFAALKAPAQATTESTEEASDG